MFSFLNNSSDNQDFGSIPFKLEYVGLRIFLSGGFTEMQSGKEKPPGEWLRRLRGLTKRADPLFFCGNLIVVIGVIVPLCNRQCLGIFCVGKDHVNLLIAPVTDQDADADGDFDLVPNVGYFSV